MRKVKLTDRERGLLRWLEQSAQPTAVSPAQQRFEETFSCEAKTDKKRLKESITIFRALSVAVANDVRYENQSVPRFAAPSTILPPLA